MEDRYEQLLALHQQEALNDAEVVELYTLQKGANPTRLRAYSQLVAAMFVFVPYLETRPQFIRPFLEAVYNSSRDIFAGVKGKEALEEFLQSKGQVDDRLGAALRTQKDVFEENLQILI